jgi:hypothetical protein
MNCLPNITSMSNYMLCTTHQTQLRWTSPSYPSFLGPWPFSLNPETSAISPFHSIIIDFFVSLLFISSLLQDTSKSLVSIILNPFWTWMVSEYISSSLSLSELLVKLFHRRKKSQSRRQDPDFHFWLYSRPCNVNLDKVLKVFEPKFSQL